MAKPVDICDGGWLGVWLFQATHCYGKGWRCNFDAAYMFWQAYLKFDQVRPPAWLVLYAVCPQAARLVIQVAKQNLSNDLAGRIGAGIELAQLIGQLLAQGQKRFAEPQLTQV